VVWLFVMSIKTLIDFDGYVVLSPVVATSSATPPDDIRCM
jgi:hypothetical protein